MCAVELESFEPCEDDIFTSDDIHFYMNGRLVLALNPDHSGAEHEQDVRAYMDSIQYWPNVWTISDHGNIGPYFS